MKISEKDMLQRIEDYLVYNYLPTDNKNKPIVAYEINYDKTEMLAYIFLNKYEALQWLDLSYPTVLKYTDTGKIVNTRDHKSYILKSIC